MALDHILDHAARALARLATQLRGSVSHKGVLNAISAQAQDLEDAMFAILVVRVVNDAASAQLDAIGGLVGAPREGLSDAVYRARIQAQILINRRSGEIDTLIQIVNLLIAGSFARMVEYSPAAVEVNVEGVLISDPSVYVKLLRDAKASGVRLVFRYTPVAAGSTFCFNGGTGQGFGDAQGLTHGGKFSGAV